MASPLQVILRRCPDCGATAQITSRGERPAGPALAARAACDSEEHAPGGGLTRTLTPALRRRILARDGHRCQAPGCTATHFLEVHHLKPRSRGGSQAEANLVTLCARCHQLLHERGGLPGLEAAVVVAAAATPVSPAARGSPWAERP